MSTEELKEKAAEAVRLMDQMAEVGYGINGLMRVHEILEDIANG